MNFREIVKRIDQINEGISQQDLADVLYQRLERKYPQVVEKYDADALGDAISDVADMHAGAEELGTSDIGHMLRQVLKQLGHTVLEQDDANYNPSDRVTLDIPLLMRVLEFSREDVKTDQDLHFVVQNLIDLSAGGGTLTMADYDAIVNISEKANQ
jgi:hypothetical protein